MNKYELICQYCNFSWGVNYVPQHEINCSKCSDKNIRIRDNAAEKVDAYKGCPPFPDTFPDKNKDTNWNF